jgi:CHAD domain-containing protein
VTKLAPGVDVSPETLIPELLNSRRDEFFRQVRRIPVEWTPDSIHDVRVAGRRLRSTIQTFLPWLDPLAGGNAQRRVKQFMSHFNPLRDIDVQLEFLTSAEIADRFRKKAGYRNVVTDLLQQKQGQDRMLKEWVHGPAWETDWTAIPLPHVIRSGKTPLDSLLESDLNRFFERQKAVNWKQPLDHPASLHALRIAVKRLRYGIELFRPALGKHGGSLSAYLKEAQDFLGWVHDGDVLIEYLSSFLRRRQKELNQGLRNLLTIESPLAFDRSLGRKWRFLVGSIHLEDTLSLMLTVKRCRLNHFRATRSHLGTLRRSGAQKALTSWLHSGNCPDFWLKQRLIHAGE